MARIPGFIRVAAVSIANALIFWCALCSSVNAQTSAPLPRGLSVEPLGLVPGLFVHMRETSNPTFAPGSEVCLRRSEIPIQRDADAPANREYWYYRAGELQALFTRETVITFNRRCVPRLREVRTARIHRADAPLRAPDGAEARWLHPLQARMQCAEQDAKCSPTDIAGIASLCVSWGDGFIGGSQCISHSEGPSQGMLMSETFGDDTGNGYHRFVDAVDEHALVDLSLFQSRETW